MLKLLISFFGPLFLLRGLPPPYIRRFILLVGLREIEVLKAGFAESLLLLELLDPLNDLYFYQIILG